MKRTTRIPVKSSSGLSSHSGSSRALVFPSTSSNAGDCDEVKKFCAEGTPSWVSKSNSHTNLSTLSIEDLKIEEEDDSESGDDELLQGLVRKAWDANPPKKQPLAAPRHSKVELGQRIGGEGIPTTQANRGLGGITTISCPTPKATGTHQHGKGIACSSVANSSKPRSSPSTEKIPPPPPKRAGSTLTSNLNDEVKIYQVEDTPVHLSEKSSFSDLTVDDPQGSGGRVSVDSNDGLIQHFPNGEDQANQRIGVTPAFRDGAVASNFTRSHSKNDSFGKAERLNVEASKVNVDRPQLSGQSGSSSHKFSDDSDISSSSDEDNDDLLANCIRSGMQSLHKSKSEPLDLKKKLLTKSNSKSSLSRLVPGVRISELKLIKTPPAVETPKEEPPKIIEKSMEDSSLASSICSTLDNIQPPSLMNSLISMSEKPSLPNSPKISSRLECRHSNLSGKKGQKVPEMVRRALDLSSSFSSCQSNLDNIKPPTEMDSSILSIASISSEVADLKSENLTILNDVEPPTLMDEVSGADKTLVPVPDDRTYTIDDGNNELSTCHDITDVFDETLTLGSDNNTDDVIECPELPRDSSRESTPGTKRKQISTNSLIDREKEFSRLRNYKASVPNLDLEDNSLTSGYKSETPRSPKSISRRNSDRFKTQTICKSDLDSDSNSSTSNSPRKTIQQKRREEADRFKTQTIQPSNIIEEEAKNVINIITESKSCARSRSASADGLLDSRILAENELAGSCDSILEQDLLKENINKVGPRICKPTTEEEEEKGIRGRRKGLYSPKKITTQNNAVTKPAPPPKPRNISRTKIPPGSPRGTRSTQLRQFTKTRLNSPPSPKIGQKSKLRAPLASPCPSTISSSSSQSSHSSKLVRQGTFTKDEPSKILVEIDVDDRKPPKRPISSAKKSPNQGGPPVIPQTRTSALRERSRSRQASGSSTTSSNRSIPKPIKTSPSNSSLNNSRLGRRTPTNVEIQRPQQNKAADISDTVSESAVTSGTRKGPKKEVTSKIASLWKKVEDTKKKEKQDKAKDKKVWISKGRVIPESDMAFLRPDEAQKKIINDFQKAQTEKDSPKELKTRSRSRLSIKLSKFKSGNSSNPLKKENSFTYTSHKQSTPMTSTSVPSTPQVENSFDQINGNKRHSRIGTFVAHDEKNSAIVPPFNYSPPNQNEAKNNAVVRRNNSYVSSMGRAEVQKRPKVAKESHNEQDEIDDQGAPTSSVMVTLV